MNIQRHHNVLRIHDGDAQTQERKFSHPKAAARAFDGLKAEVFGPSPRVVATAKPGARIIEHKGVYGLLTESPVHTTLHIKNSSLVFAGFLQYIMSNENESIPTA